MTTLHITNGDSAGDTLRTFVSGEVTITADPLHEGPARAVDGDEWRRMRAQFLADPADPAAPQDAWQWLTAWDAAIERAPEYDEVVLWFEHDLFDQLLLVRTLDLVGRVLSDPASPVGGSAR